MKFYPSSSAFMLGDVVVTKYESGCLRSILAKSSGIDTGEIPDLYQRCGDAAEEQHAADLQRNGTRFVREFKVSAQLSPNVELSGRADFVCYTGNDVTVHETKGHTSKSTRLSVIRKGEINVGYLAQLVSYMVRLRTQKGELVCGYYEEDSEGQADENGNKPLIRQEERTFRVGIDDDGDICVDDVSSGYNVADLLAHQRAAARVMENQEVADRPADWGQKFTGPCRFCPFKAACDQYDAMGGTTADFLRVAKEAVDALPPKEPPVANKLKQPKRKPA